MCAASRFLLQDPCAGFWKTRYVVVHSSRSFSKAWALEQERSMDEEAAKGLASFGHRLAEVRYRN